MVYLSATVWRGCRHFVLFAEICYFVKRPTQNSAGSPHTAVFLRHRYFFKCFLNSLHGITRFVFINFYLKKELTSKLISRKIGLDVENFSLSQYSATSDLRIFHDPKFVPKSEHAIFFLYWKNITFWFLDKFFSLSNRDSRSLAYAFDFSGNGRSCLYSFLFIYCPSSKKAYWTDPER